MFMDAIGMLILTLPVVYPAVIELNGGETVGAADSAFGMSGVGCAIWFGIIVVKMAELCLITPPIGLNCFVVAGVRPELSVQDVFRGGHPLLHRGRPDHRRSARLSRHRAVHAQPAPGRIAGGDIEEPGTHATPISHAVRFPDSPELRARGELRSPARETQ